MISNALRTSASQVLSLLPTDCPLQHLRQRPERRPVSVQQSLDPRPFVRQPLVFLEQVLEQVLPVERGYESVLNAFADVVDEEVHHRCDRRASAWWRGEMERGERTLRDEVFVRLSDDAKVGFDQRSDQVDLDLLPLRQLVMLERHPLQRSINQQAQCQNSARGDAPARDACPGSSC